MPIFQGVRATCIKIEPEEVQWVKTKSSRIRQYNPQKPKKLGFKCLYK